MLLTDQGSFWAAESSPGNVAFWHKFRGYLSSKKDGSFMRMLEVWNLPVSHDTACDSHNLIGDA